jgi:hypothetical protein
MFSVNGSDLSMAEETNHQDRVVGADDDFTSLSQVHDCFPSSLTLVALVATLVYINLYLDCHCYQTIMPFQMLVRR